MIDFEKVSVAIRELRTVSEELSDALREQIKGLRRVNRWIVVLLIAVAGLAGFSTFQVIRLRRIQTVAQANQDRIDELQQRTSSDVLCPLYALFLRAYNPRSPVALADPNLYEENFVTIERGARALGCEHTERVRR